MTAAELASRAAALMAHAIANRDRFPQLAREGAAWLAAGAPLASPAVLAARQTACQGAAENGIEKCPQWQPLIGTPDVRHCAACKCLAAKLNLATSKCPLGKWSA